MKNLTFCSGLLAYKKGAPLVILRSNASLCFHFSFLFLSLFDRPVNDVTAFYKRLLLKKGGAVAENLLITVQPLRISSSDNLV